MFRYRALTSSGDMTFGNGGANFLVDSSAATAQSIRTRLGLWTSTWFLDLSAGTDWTVFVGRFGAVATADEVLRSRILGTFGVRGIVGWWSGLDRGTRLYAAGAVVDTVWGRLLFAVAASGSRFQLDVSPLGGGTGLG